jgi:phage gpG-like protein
MPVYINVKLSGIPETRASLDSLAARIINPDDKFMRRLGDALLEDTDRRFETRGYGTWPEDAPETVKRKGHAQVLVDSGDMRASTITKRVGNTVKIIVQHGGKNRSPDVPGYHQGGTRRMPQRRIVQKTPQLLSLLTAEMLLWISDMAKAVKKKM